MKSITSGNYLCLLKLSLNCMPGIVVTPLGLAHQQTINECGEIVPKQQLTHDQSFNVIPGTKRSMNDRLQLDSLTFCCFGHALTHFLHIIVTFRTQFPEEPILLTKVDLKSAYQCLHYAAHMALQACVLFAGLLLVALHLTFGGSVNPSQWSDFSEMLFDLANDIVRHPGGDPALHHSPHQHLLSDHTDILPPLVSFAPACEVIINLPKDFAPKCDGYIDDAFMAFLLCDWAQGTAILPFVIHLLGHPIHVQKVGAHDDLLSLSKFLGEATPAKCKTILGWSIDTH
jgi:hypothetical protein